MTNSLTFPKIDACDQEQSVTSPRYHPSDSSPDTLDLLVPWDLPVECEPKAPEKQKIEQSLRSLLTLLQTFSLQTPNLQQAQTQLTQLQTALTKPTTTPAQITNTKTALTPTAIEDYDTYFHITHVQTQTSTDTALCLTHGLLTNCHKFITLCLSSSAINPQHTHQQIQGFITYLHLLTRIFNISPLD
ncbi:MAG: hypothetical protein AAFQ74_01640 [Cyanobacteria bacterium J06623_4]